MGNNYFVFDGTRCTDFDIFVQRFPAQNKPVRKVEKVSIPGRNGDLRIFAGGYDNVTVSYDCYFRGSPEKASAIAQWLYGRGAGYSVLRDTYHPGVYRLAAFDGPVEVENILNRYGRCVFNFDCKPELFLDSGQETLEYQILTPTPRAAQIELYNPTAFPAKPKIRLYASGGSNATSVTIDESALTVQNIDGYIDLDCDTQNAYKGSQNQNSKIQLSGNTDFPTLAPGLNTITIAGVGQQYVSKLEITPRWWML